MRGLSKFQIFVALFVMTTLVGCGATRRDPIQYGIDSDKARPPATSAPANGQNQRRSIIDTAYAMRGKPYRWGGSSPVKGFDCSGLVHFAHNKAGISVPRMSRNQLSRSTRVPVDSIQAGDLLFFKIGSNASHVGIYIGDSNFIHAPSNGKRVSVSSLNDVYWRTRFYAAGNFYSRSRIAE